MMTILLTATSIFSYYIGGKQDILWATSIPEALQARCQPLSRSSFGSQVAFFITERQIESSTIYL